ncbi:MAG: DUF5682 family protein, partial [Gemmataceae bacterium]
TGNAQASTAVLWEAALAGLPRFAPEFLHSLVDCLRTEPQFTRSGVALGTLFRLHQYEPLLGLTGADPILILLREALARSLQLLEALGQLAGPVLPVLSALETVLNVIERLCAELQFDRNDFAALLRRMTSDRQQSPVLRGATLGALWALGFTDATLVQQQIQSFAEPEQLGDFLQGLFALAREQVQREVELLNGIQAAFAGWDAEEFLAGLPALRLAFTYFTPREKNILVKQLRQADPGFAQTPLLRLNNDPMLLAAGAAWDERLQAALVRYGVRGANV